MLPDDYGRDHRPVTPRPFAPCRAPASRGRPRAGLSAGVASGSPMRSASTPTSCGAASSCCRWRAGSASCCYAVAWALMPGASRSVTPRPRSQPDPVATIAFGAVVLGGLLAVRAVRVWPGDLIVWPLAAAIVGLAVLAMRTARPSANAAELPAWPVLRDIPPDAADALAVLIGNAAGRARRASSRAAICVALGVIAFVRTQRRTPGARCAARSSAIVRRVSIGIALVIGPGVVAPRSTRSSTSAANASAPTSGPRWPRTCTTRCCRRSRSCSGVPTIRARSCGSHVLQERELRGWLLGGGDPGDRRARRRRSAPRSRRSRRRSRPSTACRSRSCGCATARSRAGAVAARGARGDRRTRLAHSGRARRLGVSRGRQRTRVTVFVRDRGRGFDRDRRAGRPGRDHELDRRPHGARRRHGPTCGRRRATAPRSSWCSPRVEAAGARATDEPAHECSSSTITSCSSRACAPSSPSGRCRRRGVGRRRRDRDDPRARARRRARRRAHAGRWRRARHHRSARARIPTSASSRCRSAMRPKT